jgi:hypothetical protein
MLRSSHELESHDSLSPGYPAQLAAKKTVTRAVWALLMKEGFPRFLSPT